MADRSETIHATTLSQLKETIVGASRILLAVHRNPDGDAAGSLLGMYFVLLGLKKNPVAYCPEGIPKHLSFLPGADQIKQSLEGCSFDATILLDTPERSLFAEGFQSRGTFIVIDHHLRCEDFGDLVIRYPASSVGEILYYLAEQAGWPIDKQAAICLYTSIVADTSSFRYESATPKSHEAAARLIELGADPWTVASNLFESISVERRRLLAKVLETLALGVNGKYAQLYCTREMMQNVGATSDDLEGMVNFARGIEGVELAALFREEGEKKIRVSLRSKGRVDAAAAAAHFGGGGHINAAGCHLVNMTIEEALDRLLKRAEEVLGFSK